MVNLINGLGIVVPVPRTGTWRYQRFCLFGEQTLQARPKGANLKLEIRNLGDLRLPVRCTQTGVGTHRRG